jgi:hypothetical protein
VKVGRPTINEQQLRDLFELKAKEYALKYNVSLNNAYTLKAKYKKRAKELANMEHKPSIRGPEGEDRLSKIDELLRSSGIDVEDIAHVNRVRVGTYEVVTKDEEGEAHVHELHVTNVDYVPIQEDRTQDIIRQVPPVVIKPSKRVRAKSKTRRAIIVPDLQGGFRRHGEELEPIHDEQVVDVGLQIIRHTEPDLIVLNGDNLDFPDMSHFAPDSNQFAQVMQATLDRVYEILATMRANAPDARIVWLEGNHEARLRKAIMNYNMAIWGVRRPGTAEDDPFLSIPHIMNLAGLDVEYYSGYPAAAFQINDRLQAIHGHKVRSNGSTAALYAKDEELSTIFGHVHRIEAHSRTNRLGRTITALSFGTWARIDGAVPSYGNGVTDRGDVVQRYENWQNGMGYIEYEEGDKPYQWQAIHIDHQNGYETNFDGKVFRPNE